MQFHIRSALHERLYHAVIEIGPLLPVKVAFYFQSVIQA